MPELPEVETTARLLRPDLIGRRIAAVQIEWQRTVGKGGPDRFRRSVRGAEIQSISRRGKYLLFELVRGVDAAGWLVGHLRMSGRMQVRPSIKEPSRWCRVAMTLDNGCVFEFIDVRKFGRLEYARSPEDVLPKLGPEPIDPEFTAAWFSAALQGRKRAIKPLLLDQSFIAGLGNIYVDEALFETRIHPQHPSHRVSASKATALHAAIVRTLAEAIEREGSSFDAFYRTPQGQPGTYQDQFQVYGRHGKPCRRCGKPVKRIVVGQRGTHVCLNCQRKPRPKRS